MLVKHDSEEEDVFFTADTHFNHRNIIKYCNRPFAPSWEIEEDNYSYDRVREMNEGLKENWNSVIPQDATVYFLGDFIFLKKRFVHHAERLLQELNGRKILIAGNHDPAHIRNLEGWTSVALEEIIQIDDVKFYLYHYPKDGWPGWHKGVIHLHGHSHGKSPQVRNRLDVGVDCFGQKPISYQQVMEAVNANMES